MSRLKWQCQWGPSLMIDRMRCARICSLIFKYLHKFSIMLISGLCAGHVITSKLFSCFHWVVSLERWGVALSSWKIQGFCGKCFAVTGHMLWSKICIYFSRVYCPINWYKSPHTFMSYTTPKHHTCYLPGLPISSFTKTVWSPLFTFFSPYMHLTTFISLTQFEYHQKKLPSKNFQLCSVALTCTMPFVWNNSHLKQLFSFLQSFFYTRRTINVSWQ